MALFDDEPRKKPKPHEIGRRHDDEDAEHDGQQRQHDRVAESLLELRIGEHDAVGFETVFAALHAHREIDHAGKRQQEVEAAERDGKQGPEALSHHLTHRSARMRRRM